MTVVDRFLTWQTLVSVVLLYCIAPYTVLWLAVRWWPNGHPRRNEYLAEYDVVPTWRRPLWVADAAIRSLLDGAVARFKDRAKGDAEQDRCPEASTKASSSYRSYNVDLEPAGAIGYSGTQAAKVVGISHRQLDYWARTDLIRPSLSDASVSSSRRRYSYKDLLELRVIKTLLDAGIKLESVRDVFTYLREHVATEIASTHLVLNGRSVVLAHGEDLIDVLAAGQGVLNVVPLAGVKDEVDAQLVPLDPNDPPDSTSS